MDKAHARAMLTFIAELYLICSTSEPKAVPPEDNGKLKTFEPKKVTVED